MARRWLRRMRGALQSGSLRIFPSETGEHEGRPRLSGENCRSSSPAPRRLAVLGGASGSKSAKEIALLSAQHKPILIGLDWLRSRTFGLFRLLTNAGRMNQHQDSAKARPTDWRARWYGLRPDAAAMQTFSTSRLTVGGICFR